MPGIERLKAKLEESERALEQAVDRANLVSEDNATKQVLEASKYELRQPLVVWNSRKEWDDLNNYLREVQG